MYLSTSQPLTSCPVAAGESIASEGSGDYLYVEGYVRSTTGEAIANAIVDTWETDSTGELE